MDEKPTCRCGATEDLSWDIDPYALEILGATAGSEEWICGPCYVESSLDI